MSSDSETKTEAIPISAVVRKLITEHSLIPGDIVGTGKGGRILKTDVQAHLDALAPEIDDDPFGADAPTTAAVEEDPFAIDPPAPVVEQPTIENVREALVNYQTATRDAYIAEGQPKGEAQQKAMHVARALLTDISGVSTLGALPEDKYAAVVSAVASA